MLDEFAALGHLEIIEQTWAQVRGYGIQLMAVFQDMLQLQDLYKKRWGSLLANTGTALFFRPNDMTTAEWLSKRLGETTAMLQTMAESENYGGGQSSGTSFNPGGEGKNIGASSSYGTSRNINTTFVKVPLTLPHELFGLRNGEMRTFLSGVKDGLTTEAVPYFQIEKYDLRARRNPYVHAVPRRQVLPPRPVDAPNDNLSPHSIFDQRVGEIRRKPSPAPDQRQPPALPPPPRWRGLPPPEDFRDYDN